MASSKYGNLIRLRPNDCEVLEVIKQVPLGEGASQGSVSEDELRNLLFEHPDSLPLADIDAAYANAVPICKEMRTPAGPIDALYVNADGRITLAEFKLWRNPQARREVIGQILDYAKELASWSYEDLQRQVSLALKKSGNVLFDLVETRSSGIDEAEFIDSVTRHLRRGEFLLLIVGDGIREGVESIVDFVQTYSGLHFNLALVEAALYRDAANHLIVQPRVMAQTEIVQRFVVEVDSVREVIEDDQETQQDTQSDQEEENLRFWRAVVQDYSFSDTSAVVPPPSKESTLYVRVQGSGHGGFGLCFDGFLDRKASYVGCFLMARSDLPHAVRIFEELASSFEELRMELGEDPEVWKSSAGRPRLGFRKKDSLSFLAGRESDVDYQESVSWMRDRLNTLVSGLHPRIRLRLDEDA